MKNVLSDIYTALKLVWLWSVITLAYVAAWYAVASALLGFGLTVDNAGVGSFIVINIVVFIVVFVIVKAKWRKEQAIYQAEQAAAQAERDAHNAAFGQKQANYTGSAYEWYGVVYQPAEPDEPYVTAVTVVDEAENILRKGK